MTGLRNVWAIAEKEWRHYFGSPIAWVALFVWTVLFGFFYFAVFSSPARTRPLKPTTRPCSSQIGNIRRPRKRS